MKSKLFPVLQIVGLFLATNANGDGMKITSAAFKEGGQIPSQFTCDGANKNPTLEFTGLPQGAKSLALIVDDPDAPSGLCTHWIVRNIEPATGQIAENSSPTGGSQGTNDFGKSGYGGPCPPLGTHRYFFKLVALDEKLSLKAGARRADFDRAIKGHIVGEAQLMGRYSR